VAASRVLKIVRQRLAARTDSEHGQSLVRIAFVSIVLVYFYTDYFVSRVDELSPIVARVIVAISLVPVE